MKTAGNTVSETVPDKIVAVGAARSGLLQGGRDRIWSGDGLVVRRREGAAVAQYHRADGG